MAKGFMYIGIDPDAKKNGVAFVEKGTRTLNTKCLTFSATLECLKGTYELAKHYGCSMEVVIEAGWLNHSNWHLPTSCSPQRAAAIGRSVGMNHQTGILLAECCAALGYPYRLQKPLRKCWRGKDGKITHAELVEQLQKRGYTGLPKRTNQEERDAVLLIL